MRQDYSNSISLPHANKDQLVNIEFSFPGTGKTFCDICIRNGYDNIFLTTVSTPKFIEFRHFVLRSVDPTSRVKVSLTEKLSVMSGVHNNVVYYDFVWRTGPALSDMTIVNVKDPQQSLLNLFHSFFGPNAENIADAITGV